MPSRLKRSTARRSEECSPKHGLIVGGTGALGRAVAGRLLAAVAPVRLTTRKPEKAAALVAAGAEVIRADLLDKASLRHACEQSDTVVAAAHSIFGRGRAASAHVDGRGHRDLIDAARSAGVRHFVYTSAYDSGPALRAIPIFHFKYEIEDYLKASGMSYTILRPTAFTESHAQMLIGDPILRSGKVVLFGRGDKPRNFVAADDVAYFAELALNEASLKNQTVSIGGPENLTNMDVVRLYERLAGRPARVTDWVTRRPCRSA